MTVLKCLKQNKRKHKTKGFILELKIKVLELSVKMWACVGGEGPWARQRAAPAMSVSKGCHNRATQDGQLKQMFSLPFLKSRSLQSRCQQGWLLLRL